MKNKDTIAGNKEGNVLKILETKNLQKFYGEGEALVRALDGVDFNMEKGEFAAIVGTS